MPNGVKSSVNYWLHSVKDLMAKIGSQKLLLYTIYDMY